MTKALKAMEGVPAEVAGAVDEYVAAARLGISIYALRYAADFRTINDRRSGKLGIPFIKAVKFPKVMLPVTALCGW
jgi:hypothetical protein